MAIQPCTPRQHALEWPDTWAGSVEDSDHWDNQDEPQQGAGAHMPPIPLSSPGLGPLTKRFAAQTEFPK
jgi:hypothetical protein